jgi:hypothetical protein
LEEVDIFGKVEGIFSALPNHVRMQDIIRLLKDPYHVRFFVAIFQRTLEQPDKKIYNLK